VDFVTPVSLWTEKQLKALLCFWG